ncbi:hypothetical protein F373_gp145 [Bacillus phage SP-10]|uniref:hypothetical protein n=1 Tax=Bacillus phage SP10 TaxID=941058 RepID=UPI0002198B65|nr:hypothetical protein F373_gp145 [Bacillus phage SP-10]BAK52957.1 hypothetical protein [Bacillus phage SP-10]
MRQISIEIPQGFSDVLNSQIRSSATASISSTLMATKSHWEQLVQQRLKTSRADYLLGLNADNSLTFPDEFTGVLTLRGQWANMLEEGFPAFDMKSGFSHARNVKQKKDGGWYMTVPFRHRTPNTAGSAVGGRAMPDDIYSHARAMRGQSPRLAGTEDKYPAGKSWTGYQHKNGIYEGLTKNRKKYERAVQNSYYTFRRVSDKSDPSSWKHPGFKGVKAFQEVESFAQQTFTQVFNTYIKNTMG